MPVFVFVYLRMYQQVFSSPFIEDWVGLGEVPLSTHVLQKLFQETMHVLEICFFFSKVDK